MQTDLYKSTMNITMKEFKAVYNYDTGIKRGTKMSRMSGLCVHKQWKHVGKLYNRCVHCKYIFNI